jgi:hypothetical protein
MAQRGRKSAASLAIVSAITESLPPAPDCLTDDQKAEWESITASLPAGWFKREQYGLLAAYCQHATAAKLLARMIDTYHPAWLAEPAGLARFDKLLGMRERETKAMAALATRMRLTQQARYQPAGAARATANTGTGKSRPWEIID